MKDRSVSSNGKFDSGYIEVDRSFLVHGLSHLLAHLGRLLRMSTSIDKNDCFWGIAEASCKSRSIIEREPQKYKQNAAAKAKS
jgi:hypothetical protein